MYNGRVIETLLNFVLGEPVAPPPVPTRRPLYVRRFLSVSRVVVRSYFRRLEVVGSPAECSHRPLVLYSNHPSLWDPLVLGMVVSEHYPERLAYAPIESQAYDRHWYFHGLGFFPVTQKTVRGVRDFLRVGRAILEQSRSALVITPEGRFSEPNAERLSFQRGLATLLASHKGEVVVQPVHLEYGLRKPDRRVTVRLGSQFLTSGTEKREQLESTLLERMEQLRLANSECLGLDQREAR